MSLRPNILFALTDDQPFHTLYRMAKVVELLIGWGVDYTRAAYVIQARCGPARVSLLSGQAPHNHGATDNDHAYAIYRKGGWPQKDLYARLSTAGYRTSHFGKFINGYGDGTNNPEWVHPHVDRWVALVGSQGVNPYRVNIDGHVRQENQNHTPYFTEKAEGFIRNSPVVAPGKPWMCSLWLTDPHYPYTPPSPYSGMHDGARFVSSAVEEDTPEELADKSLWSRTEADRAGPAEQQRRYEGTLEELELVDVHIARLLAALEETGQLENTVVIFSSDNGQMLGEHGGMTGKNLPYEPSARIPLVIRGAFAGGAFEPGAVSEKAPLVSHLDITATIADLAGADSSGEPLDGRSLLSVGSAEPWRERLLVEDPLADWWMLREKSAEGDLAYFELPTGEAELYDLGRDPEQLENLASSAGASERTAILSERLATIKGASGDELRAAEVGLERK